MDEQIYDFVLQAVKDGKLYDHSKKERTFYPHMEDFRTNSFLKKLVEYEFYKKFVCAVVESQDSADWKSKSKRVENAFKSLLNLDKGLTLQEIDDQDALDKIFDRIITQIPDVYFYDVDAWKDVKYDKRVELADHARNVLMFRDELTGSLIKKDGYDPPDVRRLERKFKPRYKYLMARHIIGNEWKLLARDSLDLIISHMRKCDFDISQPESRYHGEIVVIRDG